MDLSPHPSPDRSWSWIKDDFRTVPRVHLGLPEGTIGDYTHPLERGGSPDARAFLVPNVSPEPERAADQRFARLTVTWAAGLK